MLPHPGDSPCNTLRVRLPQAQADQRRGEALVPDEPQQAIPDARCWLSLGNLIGGPTTGPRPAPGG